MMVVLEDEVDNKTKKVEISTQTDYNLFESETKVHSTHFNDLKGEESPSGFSRSLRKVFQYSKCRPSTRVSRRNSPLQADSDRLESESGQHLEISPFIAETWQDSQDQTF